MQLTELFQQNLQEGPNDPHIFKAIFMAGGPGSGKTTVATKLFSHTGLKFVDVDKFEDLYRKSQKEGNYKKFWMLTLNQQHNYLLGRLGLLIDGTARRIDRTISQKNLLVELGYDVAMVFVNTDLDTAKARVNARFNDTGRNVDETIVVSSWEAAQSNLGKLQQEFGNNFFIVDNNDMNDNITVSSKRIDRFLAKPPKNYKAIEWIKNNRKGPSDAVR